MENHQVPKAKKPIRTPRPPFARQVCESRQLLLDKVLRREYALYRAHRLHRSRSHRRVVGAASAAAARGNEWRGWMGIVPAWVWKELNRGQGGARQVSSTDEMTCPTKNIVTTREEGRGRFSWC